MSAPDFDRAAADYRTRWAAMEVPAGAKQRADVIARLILFHIKDYQSVETLTGVPWYWLGPIHYREGDLNFKTHLANGDSLQHDTYHVPKRLMGRPGPFTWSDAAVASIKHERLQSIKWDGFARYAYQMEAYNGWGYRSKGVTSPYLWSQSNQHARGKYVADGVYSASAIDAQLGGLVILKSLMDLPGCPAIQFSDMPSTEKSVWQRVTDFVKGN
jgi:lysozyme family protein